MTSQTYTPAPAADFVLPFSMPELGVRGRVVRLEAVSERALSAHELPEPAGRTLSEALVLTALLGSSLKLDGRLTLQAKGSGPLDLLTVDYYGANAERVNAGLRGYARVDGDKLATLSGETQRFERVVGDGVLAITIEPRLGDQSYQGIVPLSPQSLAASAEGYFSQSEQLPTTIKLAAAPAYVPGNKHPAWRAGGIMLQVIPNSERDEDAWERLSMFVSTVEDIELLDTSLAPEELLWRLFHQDAVRVHAPESLAFQCGCDGARIAGILRSYSAEELQNLADPDGIIRARCEFCGATHGFDAGSLTTSK
ncbi:MAG TPA: Hsp33 family molecular chaperone HslO [Rhizomicrobium sp.]|jgi:molecular chaperone Hsp33|nr:Hsp33 family molecular chaperone HslO [Rhizomicrobium sp.]